MRVLEIEKLDNSIQDALHSANGEPILLMQDGEPAFVIRKIDDDLADELIAHNPQFLASIQLARQQKAEGKVKTLADMRGKYANAKSTDSGS
jgi:hypothetical protein